MINHFQRRINRVRFAHAFIKNFFLIDFASLRHLLRGGLGRYPSSSYIYTPPPRIEQNYQIGFSGVSLERTNNNDYHLYMSLPAL